MAKRKETAIQAALNEWKTALDFSSLMVGSVVESLVPASLEPSVLPELLSSSSLFLQTLTNVCACSARFCIFPSYMTTQLLYTADDAISMNGFMHSEEEQIFCRLAEGSLAASLTLLTDIGIPVKHAESNVPFVNLLIPIVVTVGLHIGVVAFIASVDVVCMSLLASGFMLLLAIGVIILPDGVFIVLDESPILSDVVVVELILEEASCPAAYKARVAERTEKVEVFIFDRRGILRTEDSCEGEVGFNSEE